MSLWSRIFSLLIVLSFTGCGYTLNHRLKDSFSASKKGIFIPVFDNHSDEVGAEIQFTNALIRELESHGEKTVSRRDDAGLEIKGRIMRISHTVTSNFGGKGDRVLPQKGAELHSYSYVPDQIRVNADIAIEVVEVDTRQLRWSKEFPGTRIVSAPRDRVSDRDAPSSLPLITQSLIDTTYPDIARDIMREVYDHMVDVY